MSDAKKIQAVKRKFFSVFLFLIGITVIAGLIVNISLSRLESDAKLINIAGKQRMLLQKMTKEAVSLAHIENAETVDKSLRETVKSFKQHLDDLIAGNPDEKIPPAPTDEILKNLQEIRADCLILRKNVNVILESRGPRNRARNLIRKFFRKPLLALKGEITLAVKEGLPAKTVNLLISQGILMNRINTETLLVSEGYIMMGDFMKTVNRFQEVHTALLEGDAAMDISAVSNPKLRGQIEKTGNIWIELKETVTELVQKSEAINGAVQYLEEQNPRILERLDYVVSLYELQSQNKVGMIKTTQLLLGLLVICAVLLAWFLVARPMIIAIATTSGKLAESNARSQSFFDSAPDAIITIEPEKNSIVFFSKGAEKMFGYTEEEILGKNVNMLMPEPYHSMHEGFMKSYLEKGEKKIIGEIRNVKGVKKNGEIFDVELLVNESILPDGKRYFNGIIRNITEKLRAEKEIERQNREIRAQAVYERTFGEIISLFSSSFDRKKILDGMLSLMAERLPFPILAFYFHDEWTGQLVCLASHGTPKSLKKEFEFGEGIVGQAVSEKKQVLLEDVDRLEMVIETGIFKLKPCAVLIQPVEYREKSFGTIVIASTQPLEEPDMRFMERLAIQLGITIQGLKQYHDMQEFSKQLKHKSEEISRKNVELEKVNRMKSDFLANMSHELRTPLNAIMGFSELLKEGMAGEMNKEQIEYADHIFTSGQHLLGLINDVLDLSKIESGEHLSLEPEDVNIAQLLKDSLLVVREKAMSHNIKLTLEVGEDVGSIYVDRRKTKQIVFNLLSNAVKFTPDGGAVSLGGRKVARDGKEFLEISVADTGIGISGADLKKLFTPFRQLENPLTKKYEGTGLGLMLTKRLAELQGGTVSVESEEGKGSVFTVAMPYRQEAVAGRESAVKKETPLFAEIPSDNCVICGKVLIVEDDPDAVELIRAILEREGCEIVTAGTVQEGLYLAEKEKPDMITLDILMPVVIGWNFLEKIKKDEELKHIPVVVISIVADEEKGFSLGAADVLQKPFRKDRLLEAVRNAGVVCRTDFQPKVLVVDDDPKAVDIVARNLEEKKFSVIRAYGGQEGIDAAIKELPDLVILDLMMPEVNGFDVVHALKEKPETAAIPIIILTAKVVTEEDEDKLKGHVLDITKKVDFSEEKFLAEVRRTFQKKKAVPSGAEDREKTETRRIKKPLKRVMPGKWEKPPLALVVEDNPKDSEIFKRYLVEAGFKVAQAFDGGTALDMMKTARPDIITLDIIMPGMGGFRFLEEKANNPEFADIPVIIVTSVSEKGKGLHLGAAAFVRKPVSRNELLSIISSLGLDEKNLGKARILVIDDDPKAVKIISSYFDSADFAVSKAYGGEEGLDIAMNEIPDLIVLDLMMPGMNGFEVLDRLKRNEATRDIHVIIMTAKLLTKREREQLASQAEMVAEKGKFQKDEFVKQVKNLISKRTA